MILGLLHPKGEVGKTYRTAQHGTRSSDADGDPCCGAATCRRASRCSDALQQSRRNVSASLTANCAPTARLWPHCFLHTPWATRCHPGRSHAGMSGAHQPANRALPNATRASRPRADRQGADAGQDKRSRHYVARKSSLHIGVARHAPNNGTVPHPSPTLRQH